MHLRLEPDLFIVSPSPVVHRGPGLLPNKKKQSSQHRVRWFERKKKEKEDMHSNERGKEK